MPMRRRQGRLATAALGVAGALALAAALYPRADPSAAALPRDPRVSALYLQARDDWARRDAAGVSRSISELRAVTRADPSFAPGFAALADAYLLAREDGALSDAAAFVQARQAAVRAARLDPGLPAANRALGFVAYWWNHDPAAAGRAFRRALQAAPGDAQTHFWYANILADNGEAGAAEREFGTARLLDPGSLAIRTDMAWALWMRGNTDEAVRQLRAIIAEQPDSAEAHDCLSIIRIGEGDFMGYLQEIEARARLRAAPHLQAYVGRLKRAAAKGGVNALRAETLRYGIALGGEPTPHHAIAAFFASAGGDRGALLAILRMADARHERWGDAGYRRRIAARWRGDPEVQLLLARRTGPRVEPATTA